MSREPDDPLARIAFLAIDRLEARRIGDFQLDPAVPLPIELPAQQPLRPEDISWQAIISAMLKLLAYRPEGSEADYYRRFILAAQPDIKEEFTRAGILKAERGELALAVEIFRSMAGLFPECGQTRNNLALVYEQQAARLEDAGAAEEAGPLREQAFAAYKAALAAEPELAACHLNFAHFHLRSGNPGKAREHLGLFLKHNTDPSGSSRLARWPRAWRATSRWSGPAPRPSTPSSWDGRPRAWSFSNRSPGSTRSCGTPGF